MFAIARRGIAASLRRCVVVAVLALPTTACSSCDGGSNEVLSAAEDAGISAMNDDGGGSSGGPTGKGTLVLAIAGTSLGVDYDTVSVAGGASLGGTLALDFAPSFVPMSGQRFVVVRASGGVTGAFATIKTNNGTVVIPGQDATSFFVTVQ